MWTSSNPLRPVSSAFMQLEALLDRYPGVNTQEIAEIGGLVAQLSLIEEAILIVQQGSCGTAVPFPPGAWRRLSWPMKELVAVLSFPILVAVALLWWAFA